MNRATSRGRIGWVALLLVPVGFGLKYGVSGRAGAWAGSYGAAVVYEIFWVLLAGAAFPRAPAWRLAGVVFAATCGLEFLQLWHPPGLDAIRATWWGAAGLGSVFDPMDVPHYAAGAALGAALLARLRR